MKNTKLFLLLFSLLATVLLDGCIDPVDLDDQFNDKSRLVLYCRLCPQFDSTYIVLSNTQLLYGEGSNQQITLLQDGVVELSADGAHWVRATYYAPKESFLITRQEFPVEEGHTYYIRASRTGYDNVSAVCTVPYSRPVDARFDTVTVSSDVHYGEVWDEPHKDIYVEWRDYPGEENFYAVATYKYMSDYFWYVDDWSDYSADYYLEWFRDGHSSTQVISDEGRDGKLFRYCTEELIFGNENQAYHDGYILKYLMFMDKNCYRYEVTMHEAGGVFSGFLLEPMHTYTNIENGFGLFGAFTLQEIP